MKIMLIGYFVRYFVKRHTRATQKPPIIDDRVTNLDVRERERERQRDQTSEEAIIPFQNAV